MTPLTVDSPEIAQRLRCPRGHTTIAPTNNHWWCRSCAAHWDEVDAEFETVVDAKTGRKYRRDDVELDDDVRGCYYA